MNRYIAGGMVAAAGFGAAGIALGESAPIDIGDTRVVSENCDKVTFDLDNEKTPFDALSVTASVVRLVDLDTSGATVSEEQEVTASPLEDMTLTIPESAGQDVFYTLEATEGVFTDVQLMAGVIPVKEECIVVDGPTGGSLQPAVRINNRGIVSENPPSFP